MACAALLVDATCRIANLPGRLRTFGELRTFDGTLSREAADGRARFGGGGSEAGLPVTGQIAEAVLGCRSLSAIAEVFRCSAPAAASAHRRTQDPQRSGCAQWVGAPRLWPLGFDLQQAESTPSRVTAAGLVEVITALGGIRRRWPRRASGSSESKAQRQANRAVRAAAMPTITSWVRDDIARVMR